MIKPCLALTLNQEIAINDHDDGDDFDDTYVQLKCIDDDDIVTTKGSE